MISGYEIREALGQSEWDCYLSLLPELATYSHVLCEVNKREGHMQLEQHWKMSSNYVTPGYDIPTLILVDWSAIMAFLTRLELFPLQNNFLSLPDYCNLPASQCDFVAAILILVRLQQFHLDTTFIIGSWLNKGTSNGMTSLEEYLVVIGNSSHWADRVWRKAYQLPSLTSRLLIDKMLSLARHEGLVLCYPYG